MNGEALYLNFSVKFFFENPTICTTDRVNIFACSLFPIPYSLFPTPSIFILKSNQVERVIGALVEI